MNYDIYFSIHSLNFFNYFSYSILQLYKYYKAVKYCKFYVTRCVNTYTVAIFFISNIATMQL